MKIGLSLSFCIRDISEGKVAYEDVRFLSTGTCCANPEDWESVASDYRKVYWHKNPELATEIMYRFLNDGKIIQPRLEGKNPVMGPGISPWTDDSEYNTLALVRNA